MGVRGAPEKTGCRGHPHTPCGSFVGLQGGCSAPIRSAPIVAQAARWTSGSVEFVVEAP